MTAEGEMVKSQSIKMSEYWEEQLKAMPYLSSKCSLIKLNNPTYIYRKARKDFGPAQDQEQADSRKEEKKDGAYQGQLCGLYGFQEEAAASTRHVAATKHPEPSSGSSAAFEFWTYHLSAKRAEAAERRKNELMTFEL